MQAALLCSTPVPLTSIWRVLIPPVAAFTDDATSGSTAAITALAECDRLASLDTTLAFVALPDLDGHIQVIAHKVWALLVAGLSA